MRLLRRSIDWLIDHADFDNKDQVWRCQKTGVRIKKRAALRPVRTWHSDNLGEVWLVYNLYCPCCDSSPPNPSNRPVFIEEVIELFEIKGCG